MIDGAVYLVRVDTPIGPSTRLARSDASGGFYDSEGSLVDMVRDARPATLAERTLFALCAAEAIAEFVGCSDCQGENCGGFVIHHEGCSRVARTGKQETP